MKRILLIGCGAFARQAHLPALREASGRARLVAVVDRRDGAEDVRAACAGAGLDGEIAYVPYPDPRAADPRALEALGERLPEVDAVIVSSPEPTHGPYVRWALDRGLPALVDKPLTARRPAEGGLTEPAGLVEDWRDLVRRGREVRPFMLAAQRRYQTVYRELAELVRREYLRNGYGPTYVQGLTNDGLWHTPDDYAVQSSYRDGAGKLVHTGYHVLDILPWLVRHGQAPERPGAAVSRIRSGRIFASAFRPADAAAAHAHDGNAPRPVPELPRTLGEVNAALQVDLRDGEGRTVCLVQIGTLHEGLSLNPLIADGSVAERMARAEAGRTKQEVLSMYLGPTSAMWLRRFAKLTGERGTRLGDRDHLELVYGRNPRIDGAPALLETRTLTYRADDDAPTAEFLRALEDPGREVVSPVDDHGIAVKLMAAAYTSMESGEAVEVPFDAEEWRPPPSPASEPGAYRDRR